MNKHTHDMQSGMAEATRLTRAGQLAEATAVIQHILKGGSVPRPSVVEDDNPEKVIEGEFRIIDDSPLSRQTSVSDMASNRGASTGSAPMPPVTSRSGRISDVLRVPGLISNTRGRLRAVTPDFVPSTTGSGGKFVDGSYTNAAGTRAYKLYIPSGYTGQAVPLMIMLHGCTQTPIDFAAGTGMNVLAEEGLFLVAYPEQATSANSSKCWNWFQTVDQQRDGGEPSLIAGITQHIMDTYHVDTNRVYVAGLSAGGAMAVIMAAAYPDLYAAVGVHSGLAYGAAHDFPSAFTAMKQGAARHTLHLARFVPMIVFHGDRDTTVSTTNADDVLAQWLQASEGGSSAVRKSTRDAVVERGQVSGGHAYTRFIYHEVDGRSTIEKWIVHQAGHAWSGGSPTGSYTDSKGPNASAEMVRFFKEHPHGK
ncbi:MAG: PHB depolymerase family esterase [Chloroflexota bacterium]|nr:PHB depolymerase family esterase [Chloroflexota bacterium]